MVSEAFSLRAFGLGACNLRMKGAAHNNGHRFSYLTSKIYYKG